MCLGFEDLQRVHGGRFVHHILNAEHSTSDPAVGHTGANDGANQDESRPVFRYDLLAAATLATGIVPFLWPSGPRSGRTPFLGLVKDEWSDLHTWISLAAGAVIIAHIALNRRCLSLYSRCVVNDTTRSLQVAPNLRKKTEHGSLRRRVPDFSQTAQTRGFQSIPCPTTASASISTIISGLTRFLTSTIVVAGSVWRKNSP